MNDYAILHRNCSCVSDGWIADAFYSDQECGICADPFGMNIPITTGDGRLTNHLSCDIEEEERAA